MGTKNVQNSTPVVTVPGSPKEPFTLYAEADAPGAGTLMAEPIDSPRNRAKGNIGHKSAPDPVAVPGGAPFVLDEEK